MVDRPGSPPAAATTPTAIYLAERLHGDRLPVALHIIEPPPECSIPRLRRTGLVPGAGFEPACPFGQWCLRPSRLPVPPSGLALTSNYVVKGAPRPTRGATSGQRPGQRFTSWQEVTVRRSRPTTQGRATGVDRSPAGQRPAAGRVYPSDLERRAAICEPRTARRSGGAAQPVWSEAVRRLSSRLPLDSASGRGPGADLETVAPACSAFRAGSSSIAVTY